MLKTFLFPKKNKKLKNSLRKSSATDIDLISSKVEKGCGKKGISLHFSAIHSEIYLL